MFIKIEKIIKENAQVCCCDDFMFRASFGVLQKVTAVEQNL